MDNSLHSRCIFWNQKATITVEQAKKKKKVGERRENMKLWGRMRTNRNRSMKEYWYNPVEQELRWQVDLSYPKVYHVVCSAWNKGLRRILKVERDLWWISNTCSWQLEKAMAPHSSTLAWKIPWMEEPGRLQSMGSLESDTTERIHFHFSLSSIGEGNGNPLQCSCLENPRDGGAWWAAVYGVTQSRTRLKRRSSSSSSSWQQRRKRWPITLYSPSWF